MLSSCCAFTLASTRACGGLPASVTGTVTDAGSPPQALVDASVNAQQLLSTSQALDVAWSLVDPVSASYTLTLPLAAPIRASYVGSGGPLSFSADTVTPGIYKVYGAATGYTTQTTDPNVTLGAAGSSTTQNLVLAP